MWSLVIAAVFTVCLPSTSGQGVNRTTGYFGPPINNILAYNRRTVSDPLVYSYDAIGLPKGCLVSFEYVASDRGRVEFIVTEKKGVVLQQVITWRKSLDVAPSNRIQTFTFLQPIEKDMRIGFIFYPSSINDVIPFEFYTDGSTYAFEGTYTNGTNEFRLTSKVLAGWYRLGVNIESDCNLTTTGQPTTASSTASGSSQGTAASGRPVTPAPTATPVTSTPTAATDTTTAESAGDDSKDNTVAYAAGFGSAGFVLLLLIIICCCVQKNKKKAKHNVNRDGNISREPKKYNRDLNKPASKTSKNPIFENDDIESRYTTPKSNGTGPNGTDLNGNEPIYSIPKKKTAVSSEESDASRLQRELAEEAAEAVANAAYENDYDLADGPPKQSHYL